jgi:hypothetical protein
VALVVSRPAPEGGLVCLEPADVAMAHHRRMGQRKRLPASAKRSATQGQNRTGNATVVTERGRRSRGALFFLPVAPNLTTLAKKAPAESRGLSGSPSIE